MSSGRSDSRRTASGAERRLRWERDGVDWPHREASRFVDAGGLTFHVQVMGAGPALLLIHGTGAATHSWRALLPLLARDFTVVAPDLPAHGFTETPPARRMTLPGMAASLAQLLMVLRIEPRLAVGHSAGAAVLARLCLDRTIRPAGLIGLNAALLPIGGIAGQVFSPLAKALASSSIVPRLFARWADDDSVVERFLGQTGSVLDPVGLGLYARLLRDPRHAAGALAMMANWDLEPLARALPKLPVPLALIVGGRDKSVPPSDAFRVRDRVPGTVVETLPGLGHLAHEEEPERVAELIRRHAARWAPVSS